MNVSFPMHLWTFKTMQNRARTNLFNPPLLPHPIPHVILSCMTWKLSRSTRWKQILKRVIDSFRTHARTLKTKQKRLRTKPDNLPLSFPDKSHYGILATTPSILNQKIWLWARSKALGEGNVHQDTNNVSCQLTHRSLRISIGHMSICNALNFIVRVRRAKLSCSRSK